jgi:dipeptidyl aminopeptidase/acylaminoacyl peptidase
MTVEERLRDATGAYTARIELSSDAWRRLGARLEPRRRRPGRGIAIGFAVVLAVVVALAVLIDRGSAPESSPGRLPYPSQIVGLTTEGQVLVLSARNGDFVRRLATDAVVEGGAVVAPDRSWVYFLGKEDPSDSCGPGVPSSATIRRVPLRGGPAREVLAASVFSARDTGSFDVSPDGRTLAFAYRTSRCGPFSSIATYDLTSGKEIGRWAAASLPPGTSGGVSSLAWGPDSRHLMFVWEIGSTYPWILDTMTATSLNDAHQVSIDDGSRLSGYLGSTGSLLGMRFTFDGERQVWAFDPESGARQRELFCCGTPVVSDRSGRAILAFDDQSRLLRWSAGARLVPITNDVIAAVWVPRG